MSLRKTTFAVALFSLFAAAAHASDKCNEPKETWINEADFKASLEAEGYQIKKFKVSGNCYEIYGHDKAGKKVEIYYDAKTLDVVKRGD